MVLVYITGTRAVSVVLAGVVQVASLPVARVPETVRVDVVWVVQVASVAAAASTAVVRAP